MALTETRPQVSDQVDAPAPLAGSDVLGTGDHVAIGRAWILSGSVGLVVSLVIGLLASIEHADLSGFDLVNNSNTFTQLWSAGRVLLLFGGVVPILIGLATAVVPLQVGSAGLAFARGAAAAFWTWLLSVGVLVLAYALDGGPAGNSGEMVVLWALALALAAASVVWALVSIVTTILGARAQGMTLDRAPVSTWGFLVFGVTGLLVLPIAIAELIVGYLDTKYGYLPSADARSVLIGPLNTLTLGPTVFWLAVPTLALGLESVAVHTGSRVRGHRVTVALLGVTGFLGFGGDIFSFGSRGRTYDFNNGLLVVVSLTVVLPILLLVGTALAGVRSGKIRLTTPLVGGLTAMLLVLLASVLGGVAQIEPLVGFLNANFDASISLASKLSLNGTSFHEGLRILVTGAAAVGAVASVHHFAHKIWGRSTNPVFGLVAVAALAGGSVLWGAGGIVSGFLGQPMWPVVDGSVSDGVEALNLIGAIGAGFMAVGAGLFVLDLFASVVAGKGPSTEPWRGKTLEWATSSPPERGNFASAPVVVSATPLEEPPVGGEA